jgi:putative DNA primase/helicase
MAAAGCISAMRELGRADDTEVEEMTDAAISWAARWDGGATDETTEREKWDRDISNRPILHLGWPTLVRCAAEYGFTKPATWAAQSAFEPECDAPVGMEFDFIDRYTPAAQLPPVDAAPTPLGVPAKRRGKRAKFDVKSSDIQLCDFVQDRIGDGIIWVSDEKVWRVWSGSAGGWANPDGGNVARTRIEDQLVAYVALHGDSFGNNEGTKAKLTSESRVTAVEKLLRSRLAKPSDDMNRATMTLQHPAGMLSLADGREFEWEEQREARETRSAAFIPAPGPMPMFSNVVEHLACYDKDVTAWLWQYLGYAMLGQPTEQVLLIISGPGGNGKSVLSNVLRRVMGDYAVQLDRRVLAASGQNDHPTALHSIKGKRLWAVSEFCVGEMWNEPGVKALSGGDSIPARAMHQNMANITTEGVLMIATNFIPALTRINPAIVRRFRILNARLPVSDEKRDPHIEGKILEQEGAAVLYRLIEEARKFVANGSKLPPVPVAMQAETRRYFEAQDSFTGWFSSQCVVTLEADASPIPVSDLYKRYTAHMKRMGESGQKGDEAELELDMGAMSEAAFVAAVRRSGGIVETELSQYRTGTGVMETERRRVILGVRLKIAGVK